MTDKALETYKKVPSDSGSYEFALEAIESLKNPPLTISTPSPTPTPTPAPTMSTEPTQTSSPITPQSENGDISLDSSPSGAVITLDGKKKGTTPLTLIGISQGMHTIVLTKPGYQEISMTVAVLSGETTELSFPLVSTTTDSSQSSAISKTPAKKSNGEDLVVTRLNTLYKQDTREISFDLTIKNQGISQPTSRFRITYFITKDKTNNPFMNQDTSDEYPLGNDDIKTLAVGEERPGSGIKSVVIPGSISAGTYWFGVFIDSGDAVAETDEENNVLYWDEQITVE